MVWVVKCSGRVRVLVLCRLVRIVILVLFSVLFRVISDLLLGKCC